MGYKNLKTRRAILALSILAALQPFGVWAAPGSVGLPGFTGLVQTRLHRLTSSPSMLAYALPPKGLSPLSEGMANWTALSVLADPALSPADPQARRTALSIQNFLKDKPELAAALTEIRERFVAEHLDGAAQGLNALFDNVPSLSVLDAGGVPAVDASATPAARPSGLSPSRPAWTRGVFLPQTLDKPLPGDALGVTVHRLANGMTVYLSPNRQEPRVSFEIAVRAGSRHDPLEATGMAHYLEHMQFKGSTRLGTVDYAKEKVHLDRIEALYDRLFDTKDAAARSAIYAQIDQESQLAARYAVPNELDKLYAAAGFNEINAHTAWEETVYKGSFPANRGDLWARVESDRLTNPVYRIFLPELETVYEEYNRSLDEPNQAFFGAGFEALYKGHPYARDIIGLGEHLKNPAISRMRKFFRDYYRPNNTAIILSGDFDRGEMLARIERSFGALEPAVVPAAPAGNVQPPRGVQRVEMRFQAEEALQVDWSLPPTKHADEDALMLTDRLLNNLLNVRINQAQKVKESGTYQQFLNEAGGWLMIALPKEGQTLEQAEAVLMGEIARLKAGDFEEDDLRTAITQLEIQKKATLEKNESRAGVIRASFIQAREWADAAGAVERLKRLTKADVLRVANRYLGDDRAVIFRRKGPSSVEKVAKPVFTSVPIDTSKQSEFFKETLAAPAKPLAPRFLKKGRDYKTLNRKWGRLFWTPNPVNDLFALEFRFDRGVLAEKKLDLALALLEVSGAGKLSAEQLQKRLDRLGSEISVSCREQECVVRLTGLEENLEETVRLALLRFAKPNVAPGAFASLLELQRGDRADRKLAPDVIHKALGEFAARGSESEFLGELSAAELSALTEKGLKQVLRSVFDYKRSVLYSGSRGAKAVADALSKAQSRASYKAPPAARPVGLIAPARPRVVFVHRDGMAQALIGAYAADGPYKDGARLDYRLYDAVMGGGMGGIYFQEVRESRALAYTAHGGYRAAPHVGGDNMIWSYAGTQADKAIETAQMLRALMARPPITAERFAVALSQTEQFYRTEVPQLLEIARRALELHRRGYAEDPNVQDFAALRGQSLAKIAAFAARFQNAPVTFYVLGDRASVDVEALKQLGDFEERAVDELFPY